MFYRDAITHLNPEKATICNQNQGRFDMAYFFHTIQWQAFSRVVISWINNGIRQTQNQGIPFYGCHFNLILTQVNAVNGSEQRRHPRLSHRAKIKVMIANSSEIFFADMRDFSETGLFLKYAGEYWPELGTILEVQTTEFEDAPIQSTKVVRIEPGVGLGVEFI